MTLNSQNFKYGYMWIRNRYYNLKLASWYIQNITRSSINFNFCSTVLPARGQQATQTNTRYAGFKQVHQLPYPLHDSYKYLSAHLPVNLDLQTNAGRRGHRYAIEGTQEHGKQSREGHRPNSCQESKSNQNYFDLSLALIPFSQILILDVFFCRMSCCLLRQNSCRRG